MPDDRNVLFNGLPHRSGGAVHYGHQRILVNGPSSEESSSDPNLQDLRPVLCHPFAARTNARSQANTSSWRPRNTWNQARATLNR